MLKRQLYKTALISIPIIVAFEISSLFFTDRSPSFNFPFSLALFSLNTSVIWFLNIYLISTINIESIRGKIKFYFLSFTLVYLYISIFIGLTITHLHLSENRPPLIFPYINASALNAIILTIINSKMNRSKKEQSEHELAILKIKNLEAEQQQLIQQLQPHFLFNTLSTLKSLINSNPEQAEAYLLKLSGFLRFTISSKANKLVRLDEELNFTQDYILLQQIRFDNSLFCTLNIPDNVKDKYHIPIYALQTLVENAIKHNAFTIQKPLNLSIEFKDESIEVKNNKISKKAEFPSGIGLDNLNKRFLLSGGHPIKIINTNLFFSVTIQLIKK